MAEETPKQENLQADAKEVSTTEKNFPMLHWDNRKKCPGAKSHLSKVYLVKFQSHLKEKSL